MQAFFDTMSAKDVDGAREILQPQGRFHAMQTRNGKPDVRAFSNEEYFAQLNASTQKMRERIWNPEVRVHGLVATVTAPYDFIADCSTPGPHSVISGRLPFDWARDWY